MSPEEEGGLIKVAPAAPSGRLGAVKLPEQDVLRHIKSALFCLFEDSLSSGDDEDYDEDLEDAGN